MKCFNFVLFSLLAFSLVSEASDICAGQFGEMSSSAKEYVQKPKLSVQEITQGIIAEFKDQREQSILASNIVLSTELFAREINYTYALLEAFSPTSFSEQIAKLSPEMKAKTKQTLKSLEILDERLFAKRLDEFTEQLKTQFKSTISSKKINIAHYQELFYRAANLLQIHAVWSEKNSIYNQVKIGEEEMYSRFFHQAFESFASRYLEYKDFSILLKSYYINPSFVQDLNNYNKHATYIPRIYNHAIESHTYWHLMSNGIWPVLLNQNMMFADDRYMLAFTQSAHDYGHHKIIFGRIKLAGSFSFSNLTNLDNKISELSELRLRNEIQDYLHNFYFEEAQPLHIKSLVVYLIQYFERENAYRKESSEIDGMKKKYSINLNEDLSHFHTDDREFLAMPFPKYVAESLWKILKEL